jgi:BCD family chlorophyll transporter-like MFS transporter
MILVAILGTGFGRGRFGSMRAWAVGGCLASAVMLASLAFATKVGPSFPLQAAVFLLGVANGAFAVAAIGSMMGMVRQGKEKREGTRMGLWGAAQAIAFGVGGLVGTVALDAVRHFSGSASTAFTSVFALEAILFLVSAYLAVGISSTGRTEALGLDNNVNNMPAL